MSDDVAPVLSAVEYAQMRREDLTSAALGAAGWAQGYDVVARLIDQGLLDGAIERGPDGTVRHVSVRALSHAGHERLLDGVGAALSVPTRRALAALAAPGLNAAPGGSLPEPIASELLEYELVLPAAPHDLTSRGMAVLAHLQAQQARGNVTIVGDVSGSQIAGAGSVISGTVNNADPAMARLAGVIGQVLVQLNELPLAPEQAAQVKADLETARSQAMSPAPRRGVIGECLSSARAVLEGVAGNAAFASLLDLLQHLHL